MHSLHTGETAFEHTFGMARFEYYKQAPEAGAVFKRGITNVGTVNNAAIIAAYDFTGIGTLADIGGLHGGRLAAILYHYPEMNGLLFEQPATLEAAKNLLEAEGVLHRCQLVGGNWFESIPDGADIYLTSVLHRWDDAKVTTFLQNCQQAGVKQLLIIERLIAPDARWHVAFDDVNMLLSSSGRIRTEAELQQLLDATGYRIAQIVPTESAVSIIEAVC
ncbi:MAG: hypothetical protein F6K39_43870 [Okeania sp. SIO3B3]|nr:hypothetical protein [Okeania sp. SIO3B3]